MINSIRIFLIKALVGDTPICMNFELIKFKGSKAVVQLKPSDEFIFSRNIITLDNLDEKYQMRPIIKEDG